MQRPEGLLYMPQRPVEFDVGRPVHRVEDDVFGRLGPMVMRYQYEEAGQNFLACLIRACGKGVLIPGAALQPSVDSDRQDFLRDLTVRANDKAGYGGFWSICWADVKDPPTKLVAMWFDHGGDRHVIWDEERSWSRIQGFGLDNYVSNLALSVETWATEISKLELSENQLIFRALGEEPTTH